MVIRTAARASLLVVALLLGAASEAHGQTPALGDGADALPGVVRLGQPRVGYTRFSAAFTADGGYTESRPEAGGDHRRVGGRLALGAALSPWAAVSLTAGARLADHDESAAAGVEAAGEGRLTVRLGARASESVQVGVEAAAILPAPDELSPEPDATSLQARGLLAIGYGGGSALLASLGMRLDRSAEAAGDPEAIPPADRLFVDLSEHDAFLLGLGLSHRLGAVELLGEITADILTGTGAGKLDQSPMRVDVGARDHATPGLQLELIVEGSPSARPGLDGAAALARVVPRLSASLGVRLALPGPPPPPPETRSESVSESEAVSESDSETDSDSDSETEAEAEAEPAAGLPAPAAAAEPKPKPESKPEAKPKPEPEPEPQPEAEPAEPGGVIRGNIRSFRGRPLKATAVVYPIKHKAVTGDDGGFELRVPPGRYTVRLRSYGFRSQNRRVIVRDNGVTVLNVELRKK